MRKAPYFNRNGDMVIPVDTVEKWLRVTAGGQDDPFILGLVEQLADQWNAEVNAMVEMSFRASR